MRKIGIGIGVLTALLIGSAGVWLAFGHTAHDAEAPPSTSSQSPRSESTAIDRSQNVLSTETRRALDEGERLVLLSLDPERPLPGLPTRPTFHGHTVLGETEIRDAKDRAELLRALYDGIATADGAAPACFNPRHGLRATHRDRTVELVICFECTQIEVHDGRGRERGVRTAREPQPVLDRLLTKAGVPLADPRPR